MRWGCRPPGPGRLRGSTASRGCSLTSSFGAVGWLLTTAVTNCRRTRRCCKRPRWPCVAAAAQCHEGLGGHGGDWRPQLATAGHTHRQCHTLASDHATVACLCHGLAFVHLSWLGICAPVMAWHLCTLHAYVPPCTLHAYVQPRFSPPLVFGSRGLQGAMAADIPVLRLVGQARPHVSHTPSCLPHSTSPARQVVVPCLALNPCPTCPGQPRPAGQPAAAGHGGPGVVHDPCPKGDSVVGLRLGTRDGHHFQ